MPVKILMPALSPTMEYGNLAKWIKKEGDTICAGEIIAEIETDKATMEVEAVEEGILGKIIVHEGAQEVAVNSVIAILLEDGEHISDIGGDFLVNNNTPDISSTIPTNLKKQPTQNDSSNLITIKASEEQCTIKNSKIESKTLPLQSQQLDNKRVFASPLAKRIAKNKGISLSLIIGTGPHGRIIKSDVLSIKESLNYSRDIQEHYLVPNNNIRQVIAKRLTESKQTVPHFYLSIECDMDNILLIRTQINTDFAHDQSKKLSLNDFIILATAKAMKDVPAVNASWSQQAIIMYNNIDIAVAVAINGGLITPIIRNADQKNITQISSEMKNLAKRAKENSLKPNEFQGGGLSISNLGMYGIKSFNAIVNPPQSCILAIGATNKRAVVTNNNKIEAKTLIDISLSCDHRVIDGAVAALFLTSFKKYIESPILMFI